MYVNLAGPGDYDIPGFADREYGEAYSEHRTCPRFTMAPKTKQPYFPNYEGDFKGSDSPGATKYNPNLAIVKQHNLEFQLSKAERFGGMETRLRN